MFGVIESVLGMIDSEIQYQNIWELRSIRFDTDPEDPKRPFEKDLIFSFNVEDMRGNPGHRGHFQLTNLRMVWKLASDYYVNLSVGFDTIKKVKIRTIPVGGGNSFKYLMILKAENLNQKRYEFEFMGSTQKQLKLFEKLKEIHGKISDTKSYRSPNLAIPYSQQLLPLNYEQIKSQYKNSYFYEENQKILCTIFLSNVRIIIIKQGEKKMNYGIPWMMIKSLSKEQLYDQNTIVIKCRGILRNKLLGFYHERKSQMRKLQFQIKSFCETYSKNPILGYNIIKEAKSENLNEKTIDKEEPQIDQIEETKVNLVKRNHAYDSNQKGGLSETFYSEEIGLMMQNFPRGMDRKQLWDIINK